MPSHIKIKLKFRCIIGILKFERKKKQKIIIKVRARSDEFLDYAQVSKLIKKCYKKQKFRTLEESLEFSVLKLKEHFSSLDSVKISAFKPEIIKNAKVGVSFKKNFKTCLKMTEH